MRQERKVISGKEFAFQKYPVEDGLVLLFKLQQKFAKPAGILLQGLFKSQGNETVNLQSILTMDLNVEALFESLTEKVDPREVPALAREILSGTMIKDNGVMRSIELDIDFAGDYLGLFKVLGQVLSFQFSSFLPALAGRQGGVPAGNRIQAQPLAS